MDKKQKHRLVVAIDFGTTYSGFGFSFHNQYIDNPTKIHGELFRSGTSLKSPTCILLNPDKKFAAFGYDAEDRYAQLESDEERKKWYFVKHFKMQLYEKKLTRDILVKDETDKAVEAMMIFAEAIKYLKDKALSMCRKEITNFRNEWVGWVLTTPAIWSDAAKQFMREAAHKAGIEQESLVIALEPEVASIFCKHLSIQTKERTHAIIEKMSPGSIYAVLDAGGGTIDIVVHKVNKDDTIKEICRADGGSWGGTLVDKAFQEFIIKSIGEEKMIEFRNENVRDYLDLIRDFETLKEKVTPQSDNIVDIRVPSELKVLFENRTKYDPKRKVIKDDVQWKSDRMYLAADTVKSMFEKPVKQTCQHIAKLIKNIPSVSHVLMVGGFAESPMLQQSIKKALGEKVQVVIPHEARNAVLTGAVMYGHDPTSITHRTCRYTYGVGSSKMFIEGTHEEKRKSIDGHGEVRCNGCFSIHVKIGQEVCFDEWLGKRNYGVFSADQTAIRFDVFRANVKTPIYTDEAGCTRLGTLPIPMPDTTDGMDRSVDCQFCYSGTELLVRVTNTKTNITVESSFNFLG